MEEENVSYGSPANAATPGSNPILAQPPLQSGPTGEAEASEGLSPQLFVSRVLIIINHAIF
jgi:hypothetical protein